MTIMPKSDQIIIALMFDKSFRPMLYVSITADKDLLFSTIADALACILSKSPLNVQLSPQHTLWCKEAQLVEKDCHPYNYHPCKDHKEMFGGELQDDERIYCYEDKLIPFEETRTLSLNNVYLMNIFRP